MTDQEFNQMIERFRADPRVELEGVSRPEKEGQGLKFWRNFFVAEGFSVMDVDAYLVWLKQPSNWAIYREFEDATIAHIKAGDDVSAISVMDEIGANHNRCPWFTRMVMRRIPAARDYFKVKKINRAA